MSAIVLMKLVIVTSVKGHLTMVLMYIDLKINDVEHLFTGLLAISMSYWKNNLFRSSGHFFFKLSWFIYFF